MRTASADSPGVALATQTVLSTRTVLSARTVHNRHERRITADFEQMAQLLGSIAEPNNGVWPSQRWPALVMDHGCEPGSKGGHGFVRYSVERREPGRIVMRFDPAMHLDGTHTFSLEAADTEVGPVTIVRHEIEATASSVMRFLWPTLIEPLHDALTEDAFDNLEALATGTTRTMSTLSGPVRRRRRIMAMLRPSRVPAGDAGKVARRSSAATAVALGGVAAVHVLWSSGSTWPYRNTGEFVRSILGTPNDDRMPGRGASLAVAALLSLSSAGVAARPRSGRGPVLVASDAVAVATSAALALRGAVGLVGSGARILRTTPEFRRNDLRFYAPLCLLLAAGSALSRRSTAETRAPSVPAGLRTEVASIRS